jgi:hypothetical protein
MAHPMFAPAEFGVARRRGGRCSGRRGRRFRASGIHQAWELVRDEMRRQIAREGWWN